MTQGIQGIQGIQGRQGIQGIARGISQGLQGTRGAQGITGSLSLSGTQGVTGRQGVQGTRGIQGSTGAPSSSSTQGIQGRQGVQGVRAAQGTTGTRGLSGTRGIQGVTGVRGRQGLQGVQGILSTVQGVAGLSGVLGTQGTRGLQGIVGGATQNRATVSGTTGSLNNNFYTNCVINIPTTSMVVLKVQTSHPARVWLYNGPFASAEDARFDDASGIWFGEVEVEAPDVNTGVFLDVTTQIANTPVLITPPVVCHYYTLHTIYLPGGVLTPPILLPQDSIKDWWFRVQNKSGTTANISLSVTYVPLEY